jgi:hypothetical protein
MSWEGEVGEASDVVQQPELLVHPTYRGAVAVVETGIPVYERERRSSVDGAQETVPLEFFDRRFQLRLERFLRVVLMVVVQLDFAETRRGRPAERFIDGGVELLAGIKNVCCSERPALSWCFAASAE